MPAETNPFFSIVVPVYNRFELALETVQSVTLQRFTEFEILVIDDGSTDDSGKKLEAAFRGQSKIRIIVQPNLERGAARNRGLTESRGRYVIFLDSDDLLLPDHLQVLYDKINELGDPDFIATKFEFVEDGKRKQSVINGLKEGTYDYRLFLDGNPFGCNVCVRKDNPALALFEEDRRYAVKEDWMFFLENLRHQQLYLIDRVTLLMLNHETRSMRADNQRLIRTTFLAREWVLNKISLSPHETKKLNAHVNYFCAIHSYLDDNRSQALGFLGTAIREAGLRKKYLVLLAKVLAGRKLLSRIKK